MDARCDVYDASPDPLVFPASGCPQLKTQNTTVANICKQGQIVKEDLDVCKFHNFAGKETILISGPYRDSDPSRKYASYICLETKALWPNKATCLVALAIAGELWSC
jgi:hypothetical protein